METFKENLYLPFYFIKYMSNIKNGSFGLSKEFIKGVVYLYTNKLNNKVYIGQTIREKQRYRQHIQQSKKSKPKYLIDRAIKKYGLDNFDYKVIFRISVAIDSSINLEEAVKNSKERVSIVLDVVEKHYIKKYNSTNPKKGYNLAEGGKSGCHGIKISDDTRKKLSEAANDQKIPVLQFSLEKELISRYESVAEASRVTGIPEYNIKDCIKVGNTDGYIRFTRTNRITGNSFWISEEDYNKGISLEIVPRKRGNSKEIVQLDIIGNFIKEFSSIKEASKITNIDDSGINLACLNNTKRTAGGYRWMYKEDYKNILSITKKIPRLDGKSKAIVQLSLENKFIRSYDSAEEAERVTDKSVFAVNIRRCCKGISIQHKHYFWLYEKDYDQNKFKEYIIEKYSKEGELLQTFLTIAEAYSQERGLDKLTDRSHILELLEVLDTNNTFNNFIWKRKYIN